MGVGLTLIIGLIIFVIFFLLGALLAALFLQIVTKWAMKFKIPYGKAFKIFLANTFAGIALAVVMLLGYYGGAYSQGGMEQVEAVMKDTSTSLLFNVALTLMGFFMGSAIYGQMIKYPDTDTPIGFKNGIRISLFQILLNILIALPVVLIGFVIALMMAR